MGIYSAAYTTQKIDYIHANPVVAGWVERPEHYLYSSARDYLTEKRVWWKWWCFEVE